MPDLDFKALQQSAMRMLATREHSEFELKQKLLSRSTNCELVEQLLKQLLTDNLQSDERFTEVLVNSYTNKGKGPARILKELQKHHISSELIAYYLDANDSDWLEFASEARQKKFGKDLPQSFTEKKRQARFLEQRGFTHSQIMRVIGY